MPQLKNDSHVFTDDGYHENLRSQVLKSADQPRSYVVDIPDRGLVVQNRKFLKPYIENSADHFVEISTEQNGDAESNKNKTSSYVIRSSLVSKSTPAFELRQILRSVFACCNYTFQHLL